MSHHSPQCPKAGELVSKTDWSGSIPEEVARAYSLMVKHVAFNHETEVRFLVGAHLAG